MTDNNVCWNIDEINPFMELDLDLELNFVPTIPSSIGFIRVIPEPPDFEGGYFELFPIEIPLYGLFFLLGKNYFQQNVMLNALFNALRQLGKVEVIEPNATSEQSNYITVTVEGEGHLSGLYLKLEFTIFRTEENEYWTFFKRVGRSSDILDLEACRKKTLQLFQLEHAKLLKCTIQSLLYAVYESVCRS